MNVTVSMIIPVRGRTSLLERCLQSIAAQRTAPDECIIVDDANAAADALYIKKLAVQYGAQVIALPQRIGAAAARNRGAREARSDALYFCDADVALATDAVEKLQRALAERQDVSFAYGDHQLDHHLMRAQPFNMNVLHDHNYISTTSLVRASAFLGFDEQLMRFQDWDLWLRMGEAGHIGVYVPGINFYSVSGGTMSSWVPSFVVRNARWFMWWPTVRRYAQARAVIAKKHGLD